MSFLVGRRGRGLVAIVLATMVALGAAALSSGASKVRAAAANCPVRVLLVTNTTGAGAQNGIGQSAAVRATLGEINKSGGVLGCKVVVDIKNEESDPTKDIPLLQQALSQHSYAEVIDSDFGEGSAIPFLSRKKVLNISNFGAGIADPKKYPYFFDDVVVLGTTIQYAVKAAVSAGHSKIAAIVQNNALGDTSTAGIKAGIAKFGGSLVDTERLDPTAIDTSAAVTRAKNSGADALIIDINGALVGHFFNDVQSSGWQVAEYGGLATFATNVATILPPAAYKNLVVVGMTDATTPSTPGVLKFIAEMKATPGGKQALQTNLLETADAHDDLTLFAWAANKTKSLDAATITKYLEAHGSTPVPGLLTAKTTGYTSTSHEFTAPGSMASAHAGPLNNGRLARVAVLNP
jgi:ABC-type branched-subunit amino acid transport system substrate-binding protein